MTTVIQKETTEAFEVRKMAERAAASRGAAKVVKTALKGAVNGEEREIIARLFAAVPVVHTRYGTFLKLDTGGGKSAAACRAEGRWLTALDRMKRDGRALCSLPFVDASTTLRRMRVRVQALTLADHFLPGSRGFMGNCDHGTDEPETVAALALAALQAQAQRDREAGQ